MSKITFTRSRNLSGQIEYLCETATHRYVTYKSDSWWVTDIWTLERVGIMDPPLMIGRKKVGYLMTLLLSETREEIAQDVERRSVIGDRKSTRLNSSHTD